MTAEPHFFFFVHIMKTAGGSLRRRLINHFGEAAVYPTRRLDGTDLNGRDLSYEGGGSGNCFAGNQGVTTTFPADGSTIVPCTTPPTANVFNEEVRNQAIAWATDSTHESGWIPHEHAPQQGLTPVEHYGGS